MRQVAAILTAGLIVLATLPLAPAAFANSDPCTSTQRRALSGVSITAQCKTPSTSSANGSGAKGSGSAGSSSNSKQPSEADKEYEACRASYPEGYLSDFFASVFCILRTTPEAGPDAEVRKATEAVVRQASAELQLPSPDPKVGPDPSLNKWNIVAVGYPIWLWVEGPRDLETTVTQDGITITIKARLRKVKFDMGDGTKKWCASWTTWYRHGEPPKESPTCGYRYQQLPKKKGAGYDLTAEAHWDVTWTANGHTGTIETTRTATRHLNIAEIQSVITSRE